MVAGTAYTPLIPRSVTAAQFVYVRCPAQQKAQVPYYKNSLAKKQGTLASYNSAYIKSVAFV